MSDPTLPTIAWYKSRVIWTGVAQIVIGATAASGMIDPSTAQNALGAAPEVVSGVLGAIVGAATIAARVVASAEPVTLRAEPQ